MLSVPLRQNEAPTMTNLLEGIKVIDWTQAYHGAATGYYSH